MADELCENRATAMVLASNEQPAPTAILSPAKRAALLACLKGGGILHKRHGAWVSEAASADDKPVSGMTVADLSRDGMLTITMLGKSASAKLTTRGSWFARTAAAAIEFVVGYEGATLVCWSNLAAKGCPVSLRMVRTSFCFTNC